jgi:hypothetical protein
MIFGMPTYTFVHTAISLVALVAGVVVLIGLFESRRLDGWTALFLAGILATDATALGFSFTRFLPSHAVTIISLLVLALTILARYVLRMQGAGRWLFAVGAVLTLYFDVFVAIAQAFGKIPALHALEPIFGQPPFLVAEVVVLLLFVGLAIAAAIKFHPEAPAFRTTLP